MSALKKECWSRLSNLLKIYNRDYDYHNHLWSITESLKSFPCFQNSNFDISCTPAHTGPWLLWIWLTEKGRPKYEGVCVSIYLLSEHVGLQKNCVPGVYLALQYGTHGIHPLFIEKQGKAIPVTAVTEEILSRSEGMKKNALEQLTRIKDSDELIGAFFKPPVSTYQTREGKAVLLQWRNAFVEQKQYLMPAQYTYGIIGLIQYKTDGAIVPDATLNKHLAIFLRAMTVLGE